MKYYCEKCECVFELSEKAELAFRQSDLDNNDADEKWDGERLICDICSEDHTVWMKRIPDYERPAQYETRTGKKFPNNGAVWFKCTKECGHKVCARCYIGPIWQIGSWQNIKELLKDSTLNNCNGIIVIADPPVPPPNNRRPHREQFDKACDVYRAMMKEVEGKGDKARIEAINRFRSGEWKQEVEGQ